MAPQWGSQRAPTGQPHQLLWNQNKVNLQDSFSQQLIDISEEPLGPLVSQSTVDLSSPGVWSSVMRDQYGDLIHPPEHIDSYTHPRKRHVRHRTSMYTPTQVNTNLTHPGMNSISLINLSPGGNHGQPAHFLFNRAGNIVHL